MTPEDTLPGAEPAVTPAAQGRVAAVFLLVALVLALLVPFASSSVPAGKGWFLSPRNLPVLGLGLMALAGGILVLDARAHGRAVSPARARNEAALAFSGMRSVISYSVLFGLYVFVMGWIGFALSTLAFGQACLWRAGLTSKAWAQWNLGFAVVLTVILRVVMGLWFPLPPLMQLLPGWFTNSVGVYL